MSRKIKILTWVTAAVAVSLLLLFSLYLVLTRSSASDMLNKKLIEWTCEAIGGEVTLQKFEFRLLPQPHLVASGVQVNLPGKACGTVETLSIVPRMLPLLTGRLVFAEVLLDTPRLDITLPGLEGKPPPSPNLDLPEDSNNSSAARQWHATHPASSTQDVGSDDQPPHPYEQGSAPIISESSPRDFRAYLETYVLSALRTLSEGTPGLRLRVEGGSFRIVHDGRSLMALRELSAQLSVPPSLFVLTLACQSNWWDRLTVDGRFDPVESTSSGHLTVDHLRSQLLGEYLPAGFIKPVGESPVDLDISFSSNGSGTLQATLQASSPSLALELDSHRAIFRHTALEATMHMAADTFDIRLVKLQAKAPQLELSGRFWSDSASLETGYQLECRNADATAIRKTALALAGKSEVVQDVFTFIKGGHLPWATFEARGRRIPDLLEGRNLVVKGRLENGAVSVPKIGLNISDVYGDVLISQGVLEGTNLLGKIERSSGQRGSLTVALIEKQGPFHLDVEIGAGLAQLPPVLARVVDDPAFLRELALVRNVSGTASGRLVLGGTLDRVTTRVETGVWKLRGSYERLPFPLALEGKTLWYEGRHLSVTALQAQVGRSEVHDVSGSFNWDQEPALEVAATAESHLLLDELFPWLRTFPAIRDNRWKIETLRGIFRMDSLAFKGHLFRLANWQFILTGQLRRVTAGLGLLRNPLSIDSGQLCWTPKSFEIKKGEVAFLDASLTLSSKLSGIMGERPSAEVDFQGTVGPQAGEWLANVVELPPELRVRSPFAFLPSRFTYAPSGRTVLSSIFRAGDGTELALDLEHSGQELILRQLRIEDQESRANLTMTMKADEIDFGFQGNLTGGTLDRVLAANTFFKGTMTGNFTAHFLKNHPAEAKAQGELALKDFSYAPIPEKTLKVNEASLMATDHTVKLSSASIRLQGESLKLNGIVTAGPDQFLLDFDVTAQDLDWGRLEAGDFLRHLGDTAFAGTSGQGITFRRTPVRGALRLQADQFAYANYSWSPFRATLMFAPDGLNIEVTRADLCTIPTPARLIPHPQGNVLIISPTARNLDLNTTLSCLWDRKGIFTGSFDLDGEILAKVQPEKMNETFQGNLSLEARNGRVYRSTVLSKIFTLLNVTEIYRGQLPDLMHQGCAYDSIEARATLKSGKILIEDAVFDGQCAKMVWSGEIDPASRKMDFTVLVSPFKTVDTLIRNIPLLGSMMGGTLVTIPVRVAGEITDPGVTPLPPTAVGAGLLNKMKMVLQLPFTLKQQLP